MNEFDSVYFYEVVVINQNHLRCFLQILCNVLCNLIHILKHRSDLFSQSAHRNFKMK